MGKTPYPSVDTTLVTSERVDGAARVFQLSGDAEPLPADTRTYLEYTGTEAGHGAGEFIERRPVTHEVVATGVLPIVEKIKPFWPAAHRQSAKSQGETPRSC